jgi:cytochrome b subunit of formate dehydrogenase
MGRMSEWSGRRARRAAGGRGALAAVLAILALAVAGGAAAQPTNEDCLACHGGEGLTGTNAAGQEISVSIDAAAFAGSAHGGFTCVDCHTGVGVEHDPDLPAVSCSTCHEDIEKEVRASDHEQGGERPGALACTMCHGAVHTIVPARDERSLMHKKNMPKQCATCHESATPPAVAMGHPSSGYAQTVHGRAILERGNMDAASCSDCHGAHNISKPIKPESPTNRLNIATTCSKCHGDVASAYEQSIHGVALARGVKESATCTDCHGEHTILAHDDPQSSVFATAISRETCAHCHAAEKLTSKLGIPGNRVESYSQSYHGLAAEAGETTVANCSSCHGVHDILPSSDPRSSTHATNLPQTCGKCHPGVSAATFRGLTVHGGPEESVPIIRWVVLFYQIAIPVIIGGMLFHHAVDFFRKLRRHLARERVTRRFERWNTIERYEHLFLVVSFIALAYSGFAIKWPKEWWAAPFQWLGGESFRGNFHRFFALIFVILSIEHMVRVILKPRGRRLITGLAFHIQDVGHALGFFTGKVPSMHAPEPHGFSYVAKAEYWALVWGSAVMTLTGILLVFKNWTLAHLPAWMPDLATYIHYYEAVLASLAILVWHFYTVIFDPDVYPFDTAMLYGKVHAGGHGEYGTHGAAGMSGDGRGGRHEAGAAAPGREVGQDAIRRA